MTFFDILRDISALFAERGKFLPEINVFRDFSETISRKIQFLETISSIFNLKKNKKIENFWYSIFDRKNQKFFSSFFPKKKYFVSKNRLKIKFEIFTL